jgi:hypothetical protein
VKADKGTKAAVGSADYVFLADYIRKPLKALRNEAWMLDGVCDCIDHTGDDGFVIGQLDLFPDFPFVLMAGIGGFEGNERRIRL